MVIEEGTTHILGWIAAGVAATVMAVVGYFCRRVIETQDRRITALEKLVTTLAGIALTAAIIAAASGGGDSGSSGPEGSGQ